MQMSYDPTSRTILFHHAGQTARTTPEKAMAVDGDVADGVRTLMSNPSLMLDVPTYSAAKGIRAFHPGRRVSR